MRFIWLVATPVVVLVLMLGSALHSQTLKDRVRETTATEGTVTVVLAGAVTGFSGFSTVGDGNTTYYAISHRTANEWEMGVGTYTLSGSTLSRDTIISSSNSDSIVSFTAGTKDVFVGIPASKMVFIDSAGVVVNEGPYIIDVTNTEAFLVRKNADGGDVFVVDTTNSRVGILDSTPDSPFEILSTTAPQFRISHTDTVDDFTIAVDANGNARIIASGSVIDFVSSNLQTGGMLKLDVDGTAENAAGSVTMGAGSDAGLFFDGIDAVFMTNGAGAGGIKLDSEDDTIELLGSGVTQATFSTSGLNLVAGDGYSIAGTEVLNATTLGTGVTASSLTSVGTISTGIWQGTTIAVDQGGTGATSYTDGQLLIGNTTGNTLAKATLTGTTNQISVANGNGSITLSTPQNIDTGATVQFANVGIGNAAGTKLDVLLADATTNVVTDILTLNHTGGTVAAGFGSGIIFRLEDAGGSEEQASIDVSLDVVTDGAEEASIIFRHNVAGTMQETMRLDGTSGNTGFGTPTPSDFINVVLPGSASVRTAKVVIEGSSSSTASSIPLFRIQQANDDGNTILMDMTVNGVVKFELDNEGDLSVGQSIAAGTLSLTGSVTQITHNSNANNGHFFGSFNADIGRGKSTFGEDGTVYVQESPSANQSVDYMLIRRDLDMTSTYTYDGYLLKMESNVINSTGGTLGYLNIDDLIVVDDSGNFGAGDTSPDSPIEILSTTNPQFRISHTDGVDDATFGVDSDGDLTIFTSGGDVDFGNENLTTTGTIGVGSGAAPPEGQIHVSSSSVVVPISSGDDLVLETGGNSGMSILSGTTSNGFIYFGDAADNNVGIIDYDHADDSLGIVVNAAEKLRIDGTAGLQMSHRMQGAKGANVASADEVLLGDGNYFDVTGTTQIHHVNKTDWQAGAVVIFQFDASVVVTHNSATPTGTEASFFLSGAADFSATADDTLTLVYDGVLFRQTSSSVN